MVREAAAVTAAMLNEFWRRLSSSQGRGGQRFSPHSDFPAVPSRRAAIFAASKDFQIQASDRVTVPRRTWFGKGGLIFRFLHPPPPLPFGPHGALTREAERPPPRLLLPPFGWPLCRGRGRTVARVSAAPSPARGKKPTRLLFASSVAAGRRRRRRIKAGRALSSVTPSLPASQRRRARPPLFSHLRRRPPRAAGHGLARARQPARPAVRPGRPAGLCAPAQKVHAGRLSPAAGALSLLV